MKYVMLSSERQSLASIQIKQLKIENDLTNDYLNNIDELKIMVQKGLKRKELPELKEFQNQLNLVISSYKKLLNHFKTINKET